MKRRAFRRPNHQTVVAYFVILLVCVGGTAYAAATIDSGDVINNSLKSADLKNNAGVKGADVRNNNLRGADFTRGSAATLRGGDIADDSLGANQVNEESVAASRVVAGLGGIVGQPIPAAVGPIPLANNAYTQNANELNEFIGGGQVTFSAACTTPRSVTIYLLIDSPLLTADSLLGIGQAQDNTGGTLAKRFNILAAFGTGRGMLQPPPGAVAPHQLSLQADSNCNAGSGVTLDSAAIDVIGHR